MLREEGVPHISARQISAAVQEASKVRLILTESRCRTLSPFLVTPGMIA
jgi:hypothetical protein